MGQARRPGGRATALVTLAAAMLGCARTETPSRAGESAAAAMPGDTTASVATADSGAGCPMVAPWRLCSVEERIYRAGLAFTRKPDGVHHDFMHVDGVVFETSRSEVQVFLYATEAERRRDTDALDTVFVSPPGKRIHWRAPATLVTSQNLAAIILSPNPRQVERIALALGAGLPPPAR